MIHKTGDEQGCDRDRCSRLGYVMFARFDRFVVM